MPFRETVRQDRYLPEPSYVWIDGRKDLTSLTFPRALAALSRFRDRQAFTPWLMRIAHNALIDQQRRRRHTATLATERVGQATDRATADKGAWQAPFSQLEERESFLAYTAGLPRDQRYVLALRFVADLSTEDTAAVLGRSKGATKMLVARAIASLRARAARQREGDDR